MSSLQASFSSLSLNRIKYGFHVPKLPRLSSFSLPKATTSRITVEEMNRFTHIVPLHKNDTTKILHDDDEINSYTNSRAIIKLHAVLEAIAERIEMHNNVKEQRDNWNTLLLNSINMMTLTASTMVGVEATASSSDAPALALKLSSVLLFISATGLLLVMNKIQPSQLVEEQRNATRHFKQLQTQIQIKMALGSNILSEDDVMDALEKVLALDKAYPLPLLGGAMLEKFPSKFEPARWWPSQKNKLKNNNKMEIFEKNINGWNEELEKEMREVIEVVKRKDKEDYEKLGNLVLKMNKVLAISGPLLTSIAAIGSVFEGNGTWSSGLVPVVAGVLATVVNSFQHGGQVGMVFEMYRNCGGFFKLLEETVEEMIQEKDLNERENGEVFEMKMALKLGRSVLQLRELALKSGSCRMEGIEIDEFASKLF